MKFAQASATALRLRLGSSYSRLKLAKVVKMHPDVVAFNAQKLYTKQEGHIRVLRASKAGRRFTAVPPAHYGGAPRSHRADLDRKVLWSTAEIAEADRQPCVSGRQLARTLRSKLNAVASSQNGPGADGYWHFKLVAQISAKTPGASIRTLWWEIEDVMGHRSYRRGRKGIGAENVAVPRNESLPDVLCPVDAPWQIRFVRPQYEDQVAGDNDADNSDRTAF